MRRGVSVSLMLDTNSADDAGLFGELSALGATCVKAPSSSAGNPTAYFGNAHEKIIVVDREIVMIQSGNWSENSIPFNEGDGVVVGGFDNGNRDMGIALHNRDLAGFFADLVVRDMRLAQGLPPDALPPAVVAEAETAESAAGELFFEAAPPDVPVVLFPSLTVTPSTPVKVTPVITPENFHTVAKKFLASATRSIRIEQQYIRGGQAAVEALLQEIADVRDQHPDLEVRIIVSPKFLTGTNRTKFFKAMDDFGFAFDDHFRFLAAKFFVHCHNKLIVVDEERVLLGSQNWSSTGLLSNREASLLVEHAPVAAYFAEIFDADWSMSEPTAAPPDQILGLDPSAIVTGKDFARGGVVISSVSDYKAV
jgi:phosphatidylserine/phosphatidylglycerophosphate/cardiolipin synthase-like enzyme